MNDQWSGKTLRRFFFPIFAMPRRSSNHLTGVGNVVSGAASALLRSGGLAPSSPVLMARPYRNWKGLSNSTLRSVHDSAGPLILDTVMSKLPNRYYAGGKPKQTSAEHPELVRALKSRDAERSRALMTDRVSAQ